MIDLLMGATKTVPLVGRAIEYYKSRKEEAQMQDILDCLRRSSQGNAGNAVRAEIGSASDRLYSKMAAKGLLVRTPVGYILPEFYRGF